jgi:hypothetical protein
MEKNTQLTWSRRARIAWTLIVAAVLMIPTGLGSAPAAAAGTAPGPIPSISLVSRGVNSVTVSWEAPWTDGGAPITDYGIEIRAVGGEWVRAAEDVSTAQTAVVRGMQNDTDFNIRVFATNANGDGPATVYGSMSMLISNNEDLCGAATGQSLSCFTYTKSVRTVTYYDYPTPSAATRHAASDIIDMEGLCYLSRSVGVICSSEWNNRHGELGQGLTGGPIANFRVPVPTDSTIVSITSDSQRNCALDSARRLWCWGMSRDDAGNEQPLLSPTIVKTGVVQYEGSCARLWDDTVECLNADFKWTSIPGMTPIVELATRHGSSWNGCGITADRKVLCFNTVDKTWAERAEWQGAVDMVHGSGSPTCVLLATGAVKCFAGSNYRGELGDGNRGLGGYASVRLPEPVIALSTNKRVWTPNHLTYTCAVGVSSVVYCWGEFPHAFSTGLGITTVPLEVAGGGALAVRPYSAPSTVSGLAQSSRTATTTSVTWGSATSPDTPVLGHAIRWSTDRGATWVVDSGGTMRVWTSTTLETNSTILVQVAAVNEAGRGPWSGTISASTTTPPARPTTLRQISRTSTSAVIAWTRSSDEDEPITGYRIQWASDGKSWNDALVAAADSSATIQGLPVASAIEIRVRAENAAGVSSWTAPLLFGTSGMNAQSVVVTDSHGSPVIGGRVTWVTSNGAFQSAVDYGLTSDGSVTFPLAPAGQVNLTLTGVLIPGGATANYSTTALFGAGRTPTVRFPAEPSRSHHVVRVTLPNGMPVMGATVTSTELDQYATVDGVTFATPAVNSSGITNEFGEVYLVGYSDNSTTVNIEYNDGVLIQRLSGPLGRTDADFQFEEMPWIESTIDTTTASVGQLVSIPVTAESSAATVRVVAPAGAAQKCRGRVLSARVNAAGRATLKVCASASGRYALAGTGAVSTGAVQLNVLGTKSLGVRNAVAVSRAHATAKVTWTAPAFTGGKPITGYTVKIVSPTGATISKVVTGTTATFTGLRGATKYTVSITPSTRLGNGVTVTRTVPVS